MRQQKLCFLLMPVLTALFLVSFLISLPAKTNQPPFYTGYDVCELLRGSPSDRDMQRCKKRICLNVISDATKGEWRIRDDIGPQDIAHRKKMDSEIRLRMKVPWPRSLHRNDSRCGKKFPVPGYDVQGACDAESDRPCCNHATGYCGNSTDHCDCAECTDFRAYHSAELSRWVPTDACCNIRNFTKQDACDLLNKQAISLAFIGDSVIRQLSRTMFLLLSGNLFSGAMPVNATKEERELCYADHQIAIKKCNLKIVAHKIEELRRNSICNGTVNFHIDLVENYKKHLQDQDMEQIRKYLNRKDSYVVLAVGLHYWLDAAKVIDVYVKKVLDVIALEGNGWPKVVWMGIHAVPDFLLMKPLFHNTGILKFNKQIHEYLSSRDVKIIDTFGMSKNVHSYDGLHYGIGLNFLKIQILLNYLEERYERCKFY